MSDTICESTDRLFSLDSDDTTFVHHAQLNKETITQERDYAVDLFTPASDASQSLNSFAFTSTPNTFQFDFHPSQIGVQGSQDPFYAKTPATSPKNNCINSDSTLGCNSSIDSTSSSSENSIWDIPVASMLSTEETDNLLGHNQSLPKIMQAEISPDYHLDRIMSFNIQNKFDHSIAASLMIEQNVTFLALQEPFGCQTQASKTWKSFVKCELQSARIDCFESQHQVILIDSWKWGGKVLSAFDAQLNGRFTSIAFKFGDGKMLGIISIYASSAEAHSTTAASGINSDIITYIDDTMDKWQIQFPDINIIVLGDLQETCSTLNRDNLGNFRKEKCPDGILSFLEDTHCSFIRSSLEESRYLTRFGNVGARGIDHIMVANQNDKKSEFTSPRILREIGNTYFPSDHALLSCEYIRNDRNNNEDGIDKIKYDYAKISRIKLKRSGRDGEIMDFDTNRFKDSRNFKDQEKLYTRVQALTGDKASLTLSRLPEIEARTDKLLRNLWQDGIKQGVDGSKNKLVQIKEDHAIELAFTYRKFKSAIREAMEDLELASEKDNLKSAGTTRGRLRQGKGFRNFKNLPISTKLRYLRLKVKTKLNLVQKAMWWIKDAKMTLDDNSLQMDEQEFWKIRDAIVKTNDLEKNAQTIQRDLKEEDAEREAHMNAVRFKWKQQQGRKNTGNKTSDPHLAENDSPKANILPYISGSLTSLVNSWLLEAGCPQGFSMMTPSTIYEGLDNKVLAWKEPLTNFIDPPSFYAEPQMWDKVFATLEEGEQNLRKVLAHILRIQTRYKKNTLHFFLNVNTITNFTRKVLQKERAAPATRSIIWDDLTQSYRPCQSEIEELQATQTFHGTWMGDSKAEVNCAFASVRREGRLGPRGIDLMPKRKLTMKDIPKLISKGSTLSRKVKRAFIKAHNKYTSKLFTAPRQPRKEFFYPFYLSDEKGTMNKSKHVEESLWKSIAGIPCKARHNGFHIAVLGRFGHRWRNLLLKFVKIMLIMRYVPPDIKQIARYPIPKPGKKNEFRPISLCDDLYCFLNGIMTSITSNAIEKVKLLHEGITSYRRGKSCATLVAIEQCFREDCVEGNRPAVQIDEDEEKFFDRVCLEIILAVMKINGFPDNGFIELKACMMGEKVVEIVTSKGIVHAIFQCGLEQGNPDSPTIANLVIKLKHDIWKTVTKKAKKVMKSDNQHSSCDRYVFNTCDRDDIRVYLLMIGYCDDNTKFITAENEENLIYLVEYYIQLAGNLSMVTKIGRKSSKCDVQFYNISAKMTISLKKCWSTAWSFLHDSPIEEEVPFKVFLQKQELEKFFELIKFNELPALDQERWRKVVQPKAHRHLGLYATLNGDTSLSSVKALSKMHDRLAQLKIRYMETPAQRKCANMLVSSMHSYVPVQSDYSQSELALLDESIASTVMRSNGISSTDCKHRIFLPTHLGGIGFLSVVEVDIIAVAREIEIFLNGEGLDCKSIRSRKEAIFSYENAYCESVNNHVLRALVKLGQYGIFIRDQRDDIINLIMNSLEKLKRVFPIGHPHFKGGSGWAIGSGKEKFTQFLFGSKTHKMLLYLQSTNWTQDKTATRLCKECGVNFKNILKLRKDVGTLKFEQMDNAFSFFEWNNFEGTDLSTQLHQSTDRWKHYRISDLFVSDIKEKWEWTQIELEKLASKLHFIQADRYVITDPVDNSRSFSTYCLYGKIFDFLYKRGSPIIIATDGAHQPGATDTYHWNTSSAFTICSLDIRSNETLESEEWSKRPVIPLLSRSSLIPKMMGETPSDIAHGEMFAVVLEEMIFDPNLPRIIVMDSECVRNQVQHLRKFKSSDCDRNFIRNLAGGTSKFFSGIIKEKFLNIKESELMDKHPKNESAASVWMNGIFRSRNKIFLEVAKTWIDNGEINRNNDEDTENQGSKWHKKYFDDNLDRAILKVNSHQLDKFGTTIKQPPRYERLTPNLALLSANHHADVGADIALNKLQQNASMIKRASVLNNTRSANLNFVLTLDGKTLDRHVSKSIRKALDDERVKRLQMKPTQGLLWRLMHHMTISWNTLKLHLGLFRSLLGMSNTHTRCMYKSVSYKKGCLLDYLKLLKTEEQRIAFQKLSTQEQATKISNCTWCQKQQTSHQHGNRRHMFLSCTNVKIATFRRKMNNVIGNRIYILFQEIQELGNWDLVEIILVKINNIFLSIQSNQTGRLKMLKANKNIQYLSITDLLIKNDCTTLEDAYKNTPTTFLPQLFGVTLEQSCHTIQDEEIGVIDGPWLGLVPTTINTALKAAIMEAGNKLEDVDQKTMWSTRAFQSWREIKALILGKAAGIHKIIQGEAQRKEARLLEKYSLEGVTLKTSWKCFKRKKPKMTSTENKEPIAKKRKLVERPQKQCNGITCGCESSIWCSTSNLQANTIPITRKQCHRCTMFNSAMTAAANIFDSIRRIEAKTASKITAKLLDSSKISRIQYNPIMNMLKNYVPESVYLERAKSITKNKLTEKWKRIIRIMITVTRMNALNSIATTKESFNKNIASNVDIISTALAKKNAEIREDSIILKEYIAETLLDTKAKTSTGRKVESGKINNSSIKAPSYQSNEKPPSAHNVKGQCVLPEATGVARKRHLPPQTIPTQCKNIIPTTSIKPLVQTGNLVAAPAVSIKEVITVDLSDNEDPTMQESVERKAEEEMKCKQRLNVMSRRSWMQGKQIDLTIAVIRHEHLGQNIFIAGSGAANIIQQWNINLGWFNFARIFSSHEAAHRKPNGLYIIPIFSGETSGGHWHTLVIEKTSSSKKGFVIDSLGTGSTRSEIIQNVSSAFAPGRGSVVWSAPRSIRQQGCECGSRTVCTIETLCQNKKRGISMEDSIQQVTLVGSVDKDTYNQMTYRRRVANIISRYTATMQTTIIRRRR